MPGRLGRAKTAHCSACGETFTVAAFDKHRAGSHTRDERHCLDPAAHWAYDHSDLDERWSIETKFYRFTYSLDANHYQPMCRTCHRRADRLAKSARNSSRNQLQLKLIQNTSQ